jgi:hypothetical protein
LVDEGLDIIEQILLARSSVQSAAGVLA